MRAKAALGPLELADLPPRRPPHGQRRTLRRSSTAAARAPASPATGKPASDGGVFGWCGAGFHGSPTGTALAAPSCPSRRPPPVRATGWPRLTAGSSPTGTPPTSAPRIGAATHSPIVGIARTTSGRGYWLASADGGVFAFGDAPFFGGAGSVRLPFPIVSIIADPTGTGYWLIGSQGTVLTYGAAQFFGSPVNVALSSPIVAGAPTPSGLGYWLVGSDGGVFTYGDAIYLGSTGAMHLNQPIVAMAPTAAGRGYWLAAADGGIFTYGDARYIGSAASMHLNRGIVAIAASGA